MRVEYEWDLQRRAAELAAFDHIVIATGAVYRGGMTTVVTGLLSTGIFRLPVLRSIASRAGVRKWFYEKARRPTSLSISHWLPKSVPVTVIGDARIAGKSDAAVRDALYSAYGLTQ